MAMEIYNMYTGADHAYGLAITVDGNHASNNYGLYVNCSNAGGNSYAIVTHGNNLFMDGSTGFGTNSPTGSRIAVEAAASMRAAGYYVNNRTSGQANGIEVQSLGANSNANVAMDVIVAHSTFTNIGIQTMVSNSETGGGSAYGIKATVSDLNGNGEVYAGAFMGGNVGI